MTKLILALSIAGLITSCNNDGDTSANNGDTSQTKNEMAQGSTDNTLSEQEQKDGWQLLFDGKTMNGWHSWGKSAAGSAWKVQDGSIFLDTTVKENWQVKDGGDIVTADEFGDFHLKLDWKVAAKGNSGIIFYVKEDTVKYDHTWHTGPEMQVLDNAGHSDASITKHRAADLYDLISANPETVKPAGEWNQVEIISSKGNLQFHLNGTKVLETTMWDDAWRKMIAASKFKDKADFGTFKTGRIALQDHGDNVWYKNVKIKKLN